MADGLSGTIGQGSARLPQNFTLSAGAGLILKVTVFDGAGNPVPLAGTQSVIWTLARTPRSATVLTKTLGEGVMVATADAGQGGANCGRLDVQLDAADSTALDGEYFHDCRLIDAAGDASRIFYGRGFIAPGLS